mmetsp:Transcript_30644/g.94756  ORF Transcript_30644/g.94756 Transcript_30644/m.94756 type:complete len:229 (-) Transcript_30644:139-825(-)
MLRRRRARARHARPRLRRGPGASGRARGRRAREGGFDLTTSRRVRAKSRGHRENEAPRDDRHVDGALPRRRRRDWRGLGRRLFNPRDGRAAEGRGRPRGACRGRALRAPARRGRVPGVAAGQQRAPRRRAGALEPPQPARGRGAPARTQDGGRGLGAAAREPEDDVRAPAVQLERDPVRPEAREPHRQFTRRGREAPHRRGRQAARDRRRAGIDPHGRAAARRAPARL